MYKKKDVYRVIMLVIITAFITMIATIIGFTKYLKVDGNIRYIVKDMEVRKIRNRNFESKIYDR